MLETGLKETREDREVEETLAYSYAHVAGEYIKKEKYQEAIECLKLAINYYKNDDVFYFSLGYSLFKKQTYYGSDGAINAFKKAIELNNNNASAHEFLGQIYYLQDQMDLAIYEWEVALSLDAGNAILGVRLQEIKNEHNVEGRFERTVSSRFIIKYDGEKRTKLGEEILGVLEEGYSKICYDIGSFPKNEIVVVLYSAEEFRDVTQLHSWVEGVYDGQIKLPIGGVSEITLRIKSLLYHEVTHAIIYSLLNNNCPAWINEGLAQYEEGLDEQRFEDVLRGAVKTNKLIPLKELEGSFLGFDSTTAKLAYAESLSALLYIKQRYSIYDLQRIIKALARGEKIDAILKEILLVDYSKFNKMWIEYLTREYYN
ncbi:MAG: tetratricopeptide repeat protein [bacterium]